MYTINILSSEDFDKLGTEATKGSDISNSLGFANRDTGKAYVRFTAMPELNSYLIDHEFEELMALESTHEDENGIRHKAFPGLGSIFQSVGRGAQTVGRGAVSAARTAGRGVAAVGRGAVQGAKAVGGPLLAGAKGLLSQFTGGGGGGQQALSQQAGVNLPFQTAGGAKFLSSAQALRNPLTTGPAPGSQGLGLGGFLKNVFQGGGGGGPTGGVGDEKSGGNLLDRFGGGGALGAASLGLGLLKGLPQAPDISGITGGLREQLAAGQARSQSQLQPLLDREFSALSDEEISAATRQIDEAEKRDVDRIRDVFRNIRPGTSEFTDTALAKELGESSTRFAEARADAVAGRTRTAEDRFNQQQLAAIQTQLGASQVEMQQLTQIAQLDVNQIATQLGIDLQQATFFKETFANLGAALITPTSPFDQFLAANT